MFSLFGVIYNKTLSIYPTSYLIPIVILLFICFLFTFLDPQLVGVNSVVPLDQLTEIKNNVNSENDTKELQEIKVRKHYLSVSIIDPPPPFPSRKAFPVRLKRSNYGLPVLSLKKTSCCYFLPLNLAVHRFRTYSEYFFPLLKM